MCLMSFMKHIKIKEKKRKKEKKEKENQELKLPRLIIKKRLLLQKRKNKFIYFFNFIYFVINYLIEFHKVFTSLNMNF